MRSKLTEQRYVYGLLDSSETVTVSVVDTDGDAVALDDNSCVELIVRGDGKSIYQWDTQNITTFPAAYTEIVWLMTDGTNYAQGSLLIGGFPDELITATQVNAEADQAIADAGLATSAELANIQTHGDSEWATVTGFATSLELSAVDAKIDTIDSNVDSIKSQTDKLTFTGSDVKVTLDGEEVTITAASISDIQNGLATSTLLELAVKLLRTSYRKVAPNIIELYDTGVDVTNITTETPIETWELFDNSGDPTLTDIYYFNRTTA